MVNQFMTTDKEEKKIDYSEVLRRNAIKEKFLIAINNNNLNGDKHINKESLFQSINEIIFAGFDYYYVNDISKINKINKNIIDLLINEEHIDKLRTTIDCFDSLEFIDNDNKYYIWYKNTNVYCNLILFERKDNNILVKEDGKITKEIKEKNKKNIYNGLQYKLIK